MMASLMVGWGVHGLDDLVTGGFELSGSHDLGDHFGDIGANKVGAQPLSVFCIKDHFHKTIRGASGLGFA